MEAVDFENPRWHKSVHSEVVTRKGANPPFLSITQLFFFPFYFIMGFVSSLRLWLNNNNNNRQRGEGNSARSSTISNSKETQGTASSTHSSSSSTNKPGHRYEAGRRFHDIQDVSYLFPNDDEGKRGFRFA